MALTAVIVTAVLVALFCCEGGNSHLWFDHIDTLSYSVAGFVSPLFSYIAGDDVVVFIYGGFSVAAALLHVIVPQTWQLEEEQTMDEKVRVMTVEVGGGGV